MSVGDAASVGEAVKIVSSEEVEEDRDAPVVHVEGVEKGSIFSFLGKKEGAGSDDASRAAPPNEKEEESSPHKEEVVHEGDNIKTTYDVEEDVRPSLFEQLKRKLHWNGR